MDFTNKLIYIYDTQKWNMTILTIRIEKEERKKKKKKKKSSKSLRYYTQLQKQSLCGTIYRLIS